MDCSPIQVQMLGRFVIRQGDCQVHVSTRSRKLCMLLAVLLRERGRPISYSEWLGLLQLDEGQRANPLNALKGLLHRARLCLSELEQRTGQSLILHRDGCLQWTPKVPTVLDAEEFFRLSQTQQEASALEALALYQGDFLPALSGFPWAAQQADTLHQRYLQTVRQVLPLLEQQARWQETAQISGAALALEPCQEDLCSRQLEALLHLDRRQEAVQVYEAFQERLLAQLGVMPSDRLRALCQKARQGADPRLLSPDTLLERLAEPPQSGALVCDFDFFRVLCHATARRAGRDDGPVHVALISLSGAKDAPLPRYSLDRAMGNLQRIIVASLRRGDAVTRCGASQFVILLPQAGRKNSQMVCKRIMAAFTRQFPHSPVALSVSVQPLSPPGSSSF